MPSRGRVGHTDLGRVRADVVPGDREGQSCSPALLALVTRHFMAAGLTVQPNDPYKGGFITTHHGRPAERIHAIQIELRRDLYMDEEKFTVAEPGFDRLRGLIAGLLSELRGFRP
jgi:N-formylglutamate deformylase